METPIVPSTPAPGTDGHSQKNIAIIAGGAVILIIILVAGYYFLRGGRGLSGATPAFAISVGPAAASPLYTIDHTNGALKPLTVTVNGAALPVLDAVKAPDGSWYYILAERSSTPVGNLYVQKPGGTATALTTSKTAKYNLSYDAQSGRLAYQALTYKNVQDFVLNQHWDLTIYDPATQKESVVAKGLDPHLMSGGQVLMYRDDMKLNVEALGSHATSTIANLPQGMTVYAVNAKNTALSIYNPVSHAIDVFAISPSASLSYVSSSKVSIPPISIGYTGDTLLAAYVTKNGDKIYYVFSRPDLSSLNAVSVLGTATGTPQRIYTYE